MRLESKTRDPRYKQLEKSLAPLPKEMRLTIIPGAITADVRSIVQTFDSLHVPPKKKKEVKPKTELKALEYIQEQGFAFFNSLVPPAK